MVQPDSVADDLGREPIAGVAGAGGSRHPAELPASPRPGKEGDAGDVIHAVAITPDGKRVLTTHHDGRVRLWRVAD